MKPQRERFWGLYDTHDAAWLLLSATPLMNWGHKESWGTGSRKRFGSAEEANRASQDANLVAWIVPRPFYVVRKPRAQALPSVVVDIINRARLLCFTSNDLLGSYIGVLEEAVRAYDASVVWEPCGISSSS